MGKRRRTDSDESDNVVVRSDRSVSVDSEEQAMRDADNARKKQFKTGQVQDTSGKNKLNLGAFHRNNLSKKKQKKPTMKKRVRDLERFLDREGVPEEIREAKKKELKELKKQSKKQKEALKFQMKYKKIKFTEKRKVIRLMEKVKKQITEGEKSLSEQEKQEL